MVIPSRWNKQTQSFLKETALKVENLVPIQNFMIRISLINLLNYETLNKNMNFLHIRRDLVKIKKNVLPHHWTADYLDS